MASGLGGRPPISSAYRARRAVPGSGIKYVMMGAAGLGGLLLVGMTGWAMTGRRPATVPVIEADSRPIRVKPDNPGGMQVAGADEQDGAEKMAPAPETPAPQALRAQMQQSMSAAPAAIGAPAAAPPAAVPAVGAAPGASPLPDTPTRPLAIARAPASSAPIPTAPAQAALSAKSASGGALVQLAAVDSETAAQAEWQRLTKKMPDLLGDRRPTIQKAERDGKSIWRIRTGGFADIAEATGFCAKLRAKGGGCTIASF